MNSIYNIKKPESEASEEYIINALKNIGREIPWQAPNHISFPQFDLVCIDPHRKIASTIECKLDTYPNEKVAIEHKQSGKLSGINLSKSDFYFIHKSATETIHWIKTEELKNYIIEYSLKPLKCNGGATECYIVPLSIFERLIA